MDVFPAKGSFKLRRVLGASAIGFALLMGIGTTWNCLRPQREIIPSTQCMTNLHDLAMALSAYRMDYGSYPATLGGHVKRDAHRKVVPLEKTRTAGSLAWEYVRTVKSLHCPLSGTSDTAAVVQLLRDGKVEEYYAYDSYDVFCGREPVMSGRPVRVGPEAIRYTKSWAGDRESVGRFAAYGKKDTAELRAYDYGRQMRFLKAPGSTVVTWCSYHASRDTDYVPILFLDGHCDKVPIGDIEGDQGRGGSRWRMVPKD